MRRPGAAALALTAVLASGPLMRSPACAEQLAASVRDMSGAPVRDAVVYALPLNAAASASAPRQPVEIDQVNKEFVPYVTALTVGTKVNFPNRDQIRHHVYSFSGAKTFEIPLYSGMPTRLVEFDTPGEVVLGCNIHDWMKAYIFVSETPYFAVTEDSGTAAIELPRGDYRVEVWHPRLEGKPEATGRQIRVGAGESPALEFSIEQKRVWTPRRAPSSGDADYR